MILGYVLAAACLIWVLHDFHIMQALKELARVSWKWVLIGMAFDVLSYGVQALRWKWLMTPFGKVKLTHSIRAVYAGLFANLLFPLRPGELLRSLFDIGFRRHLDWEGAGIGGSGAAGGSGDSDGFAGGGFFAGGFAAEIPAGGGHAGNCDAGTAGAWWWC